MRVLFVSLTLVRLSHCIRFGCLPELRRLFEDERVMNGLYERLEEVGYGTFATVYKCKALSSVPLKEGRLISKEHLDMLQIVARDSPEIEFIKTEQWDYDAYSNEKKAARAAFI